MKGWLRLSLTSCMAIGMAVMLAWLPHGERMHAGSFQAFGSGGSLQMSDDNLVDFMLALPVASSIRRVDWSRSVLSVDLAVRADAGDPEPVYHDLFMLARAGFAETDNVDRILARVVRLPDESSPGGREALLVALDAKRRQMEGNPPPDAKADPQAQEAYIRRVFELTLTPSGKQQFGR